MIVSFTLNIVITLSPWIPFSLKGSIERLLVLHCLSLHITYSQQHVVATAGVVLCISKKKKLQTKGKQDLGKTTSPHGSFSSCAGALDRQSSFSRFYMKLLVLSNY